VTPLTCLNAAASTRSLGYSYPGGSFLLSWLPQRKQLFSRLVFTTLCTTLVPTRSVRATLRMPIPCPLRTRIRASTAGLTGRRPSFVPLARALARPALTRSRIIPRCPPGFVNQIRRRYGPPGVGISVWCGESPLRWNWASLNVTIMRVLQRLQRRGV
jgi:hypothetical protein